MKRKTIRSHRDFLTTADDKVVINHFFITKMKKMAKKDPRYGVIASKRTFKIAVQRNRAKRLLRDWVAFNEDLMLPNMDYIFIARDAILECSREVGRRKVKNALKKVSK